MSLTILCADCGATLFAGSLLHGRKGSSLAGSTVVEEVIGMKCPGCSHIAESPGEADISIKPKGEPPQAEDPLDLMDSKRRSREYYLRHPELMQHKREYQREYRLRNGRKD